MFECVSWIGWRQQNIEAKFNELLLHSIPKSWGKKDFLQGFYFEAVTFKKEINMFERLDIVEYIYEGVAEPFY